MSARISTLAASQALLRGDVAGRAHHGTLTRQRRVHVLAARRLGQAEVEHLDDVLLALAGQDQVLRLDVAVDHALLEGVLQTRSPPAGRSSKRSAPAAGRGS